MHVARQVTQIPRFSKNEKVLLPEKSLYYGSPDLEGTQSVAEVTIILLLRTLKPTPLPISDDPKYEAYLAPCRQPSSSIYLHKKYIQVVPSPAIQTGARRTSFHPLSPLQDSRLITRPGRTSRPGKQTQISTRRSALPQPTQVGQSHSAANHSPCFPIMAMAQGSSVQGCAHCSSRVPRT